MSATPLQWEEREPNKWRAETDYGTYVALRDLSDGTWVCNWRAFGSGLMGEDIYRGSQSDGHIAAATAHHSATTRAAAWERYMAENDPPEVAR